MDNKKIKIIITVLIIIIISLTGYIIYDKTLEKNASKLNNNIDNQINDQKEQNNNNQTDNNKQESTNDDNQNNIEKISAVFVSDTFDYLTMWDNQTFSYSYTLKNDEQKGFLGKYEISDNYIILKPLFETDHGINKTFTGDDKAIIIIEDISIKIRKDSSYQLHDENNNIKLTRANQSPSADGANFYTALKGLLNNYKLLGE